MPHRRHAALHPGIHQRGFSDVGDAHDHQPQRLERIVAVWRQLLRQRRQLRHIAGFLGGNRHRKHPRLLVEIVQPGARRLRVGQVGLVQQFEAGALAMRAQLVNHRVAARFR
jgi:hypothetical protein